MTEEKEPTVDIEWQFHCFRRHILTEALAPMILFAGITELIDEFTYIVKTAKDGVCALKCMPCGKNIFGQQSLGGIIFIQSLKSSDGRHYRMLAPVCRDCAEGDIDLLESRAMNYFKKNMSAINVEVML